MSREDRLGRARAAMVSSLRGTEHHHETVAKRIRETQLDRCHGGHGSFEGSTVVRASTSGQRAIKAQARQSL